MPFGVKYSNIFVEQINGKMASLLRPGVTRISKSPLILRTAITTRTGAILPEPQKYYKFGIFRVALVIIPFLTGGMYLAKTLANVLEENKLFVPDDDDDD